MGKKTPWILAACGLSVGLLFLFRGAMVGAQAQVPGAVCFWSAYGPLCVARSVRAGGDGPDGEALLAALLAGPTPEEQAQGLWTAIPAETTLDALLVGDGGALTVRLRVPAPALEELDHEMFEVIVRQIGSTLEPLAWRALEIETWDGTTRAFVPLADFLPPIPAPRKATVLSGEEAPDLGAAYVGQPPAAGQGQPQGSLSGKTVYVSAGHGWEWRGGPDWRVQRPPYPLPPYEHPIIEDHNNAEVVNQYLLQYLWNAGARVIPVRERDMNAEQVIVDNDAPGAGAGYVETGTWSVSEWSGYDGSTYRFAETVTGTATATAVWSATLPTDGQYAVYAWYLHSSNRTPDAHYTIHHAGGETTVVVDQRVHGSTWHYLGSYGFHGGQAARVTLTNRSSVTQTTVAIADAVRFGGGAFDDLTGIETAAPFPPDKPWWEVSSFYYTQRMGMDQPPGDVTARPIYARWEHAGTGDDAVYVSWHTNGASGGYQEHTRGTMSIIHNGYGNPITPGSEDLRDLIHAELVQDIQAGWDASWPGAKRSMNLGELRELWDAEEAARMPGALIEIAYHDHPTDTDALKEPYFNMLTARAVYQGIVKYFAQRDGETLPLLPEPPTHLSVRNVGAGALRVAWRPPPTDTVELVGHAATGYRVYTSTTGLGWSNGISVTTSTAYTLTGLAENQLLFVRVSATNAGGESLPSEVMGARVGDGAGVLVVSGFDRLNRTMALPDYDAVEGYNVRLFLDRMNGYNYLIQHGEAIAYPFDSASNEAVIDGDVDLSTYSILDWVLGEESAPDQTLDATERTLLASYLDGDGALFISGSEIGYHLDDQGAALAFYNAYLHADFVADDAGTYAVTPTVGAIFAGLDPFRFDAVGMYDVDYADRITPSAGSTAALGYHSGGSGTAAVQYADGCRRVVHFGFPFETIQAQHRAAVMGRVLDFLDACLLTSVDTAIAAPLDGGVYRVTPSFTGTASMKGPGSLDRVAVQVERDDGTYWDENDWIGTATWLTATGKAVWSYTLPALSEGDYVLRARAWTSDPYSDTSPAEVAFTYDTVPPTTTHLITPTGGVTVPSSSDVALVWAPVAPDGGSALAYRVQLDGAAVATTTQTAYTVTAVAVGPHTWQVQVVDGAGNASDWATGAFAVRRSRVFLPLVLRQQDRACGECLVNGGFESDAGWTLNQLAVYATDPVHGGARSVRVGIPPGEEGGYGYSSVMQTLTVTGGTDATLTLWLYPMAEGGDAGDYHYVGIRDQGDVYHALDHWSSDARAWERRQYDLSPYLGQTVTLYIGTRNDGDGETSALYVDDVSLQICQ